MAKSKHPPITELLAADAANPALANPAVARCCQAWMRNFQMELGIGSHHVTAELESNKVYRYNLPPLTSRRNIAGYIACVAYGAAIGAIKDREISKLVYTACVAWSMLPAAAEESPANG